MKRAIIILLILAASTAHSQDIAGVWQGVLTQPSGAFATSYAYYLTLEQDKDSIHGMARVEIANSDNFGVIELVGHVENDKLIYRCTKVTDKYYKNGNSQRRWCLINANLSIDLKENVLEGSWDSDDQACGTGELVLYKSDLEFNTTAESFNQGSMDDLKMEISGKSDRHVKVALRDINFASNSAVLNKKAMTSLDEVYVLMLENPEINIKITGHTDAEGSDAQNFKLSKKRAQAAYDYLIKKGIAADRLAFEGYGESRPIADNTTEEGKKKNRRLEIEILK